MLSPARLGELEGFLLELNNVSAEVILPIFRASGDAGLEDKGKGGAFDPVTAADRGAEAAIRKAISARFPEHGVIGEEYGEDRPDAELVWVLDPIDGTRAFMAGIPMWTTLIGLRYQGKPVLGSIGQPFLGEIFAGHAGKARRFDKDGETPLRTRACKELSLATLATTDPHVHMNEDERTAWARVRAAARLARTGCDAYAYALVAHGMIDCVIESGLKAWDIDAAIPVIEGAGGVVTDWNGRPVGKNGGQIVIVGDRALLAPVIALLTRA